MQDYVYSGRVERSTSPLAVLAATGSGSGGASLITGQESAALPPGGVKPRPLLLGWHLAPEMAVGAFFRPRIVPNQILPDASQSGFSGRKWSAVDFVKRQTLLILLKFLLARPKRFELLTPKFVVWCPLISTQGATVFLGVLCRVSFQHASKAPLGYIKVTSRFFEFPVFLEIGKIVAAFLWLHEDDRAVSR